MHRVDVPLWFALILKSQGKCSLVPPEWLTFKQLTEFYQYETSEIGSFSKLPSNWLELSKIFFDKASDDVNDEVHKLKSLIQDLKEIRMVKVKKGLTLVNESHLQLDNLSLMEINEIRPFVVSVMSKLTKLNDAVGEDDSQMPDNEN